MSVAIDEVWIGNFIKHLQIVTTTLSLIYTLYNSLQHALSFLSECCIFTGCHLVTASNPVASSLSLFTSLLAGDCLTGD
jgi:hypothetical protein